MLSIPYIIRDAAEGDIPGLSVLITELGYPCAPQDVQARFANISQHPDYRTLVITDGEKAIGMAGLVKGFWYERNAAYVRILAFVITETYRGKGLGKMLIQAVEDWARSIGADSVILSSGNRDERVGAHQFYQSLDYHIKSSGFIKQL